MLLRCEVSIRFYELIHPPGSICSALVQDLSFNLLSTLPAEMGGLTQLQVLNLQGNPLTSLPCTPPSIRVSLWGWGWGSSWPQ
jgi:hypothetical protein